MTDKLQKRRPSQRRIGMRIRIKAEHADEAAALFEQQGFKHIYIEHRDDGDVSYWFAKASGDIHYRIMTAIPRHFYAMQAVVGRFVVEPSATNS